MFSYFTIEENYTLFWQTNTHLWSRNAKMYKKIIFTYYINNKYSQNNHKKLRYFLIEWKNEKLYDKVITRFKFSTIIVNVKRSSYITSPLCSSDADNLLSIIFWIFSDVCQVVNLLCVCTGLCLWNMSKCGRTKSAMVDTLPTERQAILSPVCW